MQWVDIRFPAGTDKFVFGNSFRKNLSQLQPMLLVPRFLFSGMNATGVKLITNPNYEGCPQNKVLNEFSQLKTCLLALNNTFLESLDFPLFFDIILESLDFPLFFDIIAVEINAFLHAVYHLLYA
jgi:hypothetical protein